MSNFKNLEIFQNSLLVKNSRKDVDLAVMKSIPIRIKKSEKLFKK